MSEKPASDTNMSTSSEQQVLRRLKKLRPDIQRESKRLEESNHSSVVPVRTSLKSTNSASSDEHFTLEALQAATDSFSDERRIGSGSFGSVYRGTLPSGHEVAIKRVEDLEKLPSSAVDPAWRRDCETVFNSVITALARANHKNIICLLGSYADSGERVLVYEFMANGTLQDQLYSRNPLAPPLASWRGRLTIALEVARGLEYMHVYAVPRIIHRNVKSSNILLDDSWTAKIAGFGLSSVWATGLHFGGTVGYTDPEYYRLQDLTDKIDVFRFGVVLLQLLCGCRAVQSYPQSVTPINVVGFAKRRILAGNVASVLDPRLPELTSTADLTKVLTDVGDLAADCVGIYDRPSMTVVVDALEGALAAYTADRRALPEHRPVRPHRH